MRQISQGSELSQILKRAKSIPFNLKPFARIIPTFLNGKRLGTGNKISEKGKNKSRRTYVPNVQYCFLHSRLLGMNILSRVTADTLRTIDKKGGLDEYLLNAKDDWIADDWAKFYQDKVKEAYEVAKREGTLPKELEDIYERREKFLKMLDSRKSGMNGNDSIGINNVELKIAFQHSQQGDAAHSASSAVM